MTHFGVVFKINEREQNNINIILFALFLHNHMASFQATLLLLTLFLISATSEVSFEF